MRDYEKVYGGSRQTKAGSRAPGWEGRKEAEWRVERIKACIEAAEHASSQGGLSMNAPLPATVPSSDVQNDRCVGQITVVNQITEVIILYSLIVSLFLRMMILNHAVRHVRVVREEMNIVH